GMCRRCLRGGDRRSGGVRLGLRGAPGPRWWWPGRGDRRYELTARTTCSPPLQPPQPAAVEASRAFRRPAPAAGGADVGGYDRPPPAVSARSAFPIAARSTTSWVAAPAIAGM